MKLLAGQQNARESDRAAQACNDWLRLGPGRTLPELAARYKQEGATTGAGRVASVDTLKKWSTHYGWADRAREFDARLEERKTQEVESRRRMVLEEGLALDFERVASLKKLAKDLEDQIYETDDKGRRSKLWLPDVKSVGVGLLAERVDIVRFNAAIIEQFRGVLEDLAKEVGGRKHVIDINIIRKEAQRLADQLGLDVDDLVAEAERIVAEHSRT